MPPIHVNRRRFLGCSAAAGLALTQGVSAEPVSPPGRVRVGVVGLGNRGTTLLRTVLESSAVQVNAVADPDPKHRQRGLGIVEKATRRRPDAFERSEALLERNDVDALLVAVPCDLHAELYSAALRAGKHLYGEKPLGLTAGECDAVAAEARRHPELVAHVGFQRRSNARFRDGVARIVRGELGPLIEASGSWTSSNGPVNGHGGWLASRARSGDWMVEQAVHVWDVLHWLSGGTPVRAFGQGRRGLFAATQPGRDVTDHYSVLLEWADGFQASFRHSWVAPADDNFTGSTLRVVGTDGGVDFSTGGLTWKDRTRPRLTLNPGPQADTRDAVKAFLDAVRSPEPLPPPITLGEARSATMTGILVRKAVDERRLVSIDELSPGPEVAPSPGDDANHPA